MTWHTPKTWVPFEEVDADELNEQLRDNPAYLKAAIDTEVAARIAARGAANGVASLDSGGKVPDGQIPDGITRDSELATAVANAVAALVNSAPSTLDTLAEIATALGNDPNLATTLTNLIATEAANRAAEDATLLKTDGSRTPSASMIPATTYWSEANPIGAISNIGGYATANFDVVTINKRRADTDILVDFGASAYVDTPGPLLIAVSIDGGAAAQIGVYYFNETGAHRSFGAVGSFGGFGAGAHTVQVQFWWVPTGYCQSDANDTGTVIVHEAINT